MLIFAGTFYFCFGLASARVTARMRYAYLSAVLSQPATYFETVGSGEVASRMSRDIVLVSTGVGEKLGFACWSVGAIMTGIIVSLYAAPKIGGVLFSILPFCVLSFGLAGWLSSAASARISKAEGNAATFLEQVLSSCRTVKVLKAKDTLVAVYDNYLEAVRRPIHLLTPLPFEALTRPHAPADREGRHVPRRVRGRHIRRGLPGHLFGLRPCLLVRRPARRVSWPGRRKTRQCVRPTTHVASTLKQDS
jgi:hypothetical protein